MSADSLVTKLSKRFTSKQGSKVVPTEEVDNFEDIEESETLLYRFFHNPVSEYVRAWHHYGEELVLDFVDFITNTSNAGKDTLEIGEFMEQVVKEQNKLHDDQSKLFFWVRNGNLSELKEKLAKEEYRSKIEETDSAGANIVHLAYLFAQYSIGHYLVETYPQLALQPYSGEIPKELEYLEDAKPEWMPYTGENILHIVIVRRDYAEVRWLLDFYRNHRDSVPHGLSRLLAANATGSFFDRNGDFYFGGYPLHFAACSNNTEIFDLVLAFASALDADREMEDADGVDEHKDEARSQKTASEKHALKMFGPNVIFMRDINGNTLLHLCVIRGLKEMYAHVRSVAESIITRQIKNLYSEKKGRGDSYSGPYDLPLFEEHGKATEVLSGTYGGFLPKPRGIMLPVDVKKYNEWVANETAIKMDERIMLALNDELHSPLTLAAACSDPDKDQMISFLIQRNNQHLWTYGPVKASMINVDGLEVKYSLDRYNIPKNVRLEHPPHSAIDWLCITESEKGVMIPEIRKIIELKWKRFGKPKFKVSFVVNLFIAVAVTVLLVFNNSTPTSSPVLLGEYLVNILYPLLVVIFLSLALPEFPYVMKYGFDYWGVFGGVRGVAKFDRKYRTVKILAFLVACIAKVIDASREETNQYRYTDPVTGDESFLREAHQENISDRAFIVSMAICVLTSWVHMYYYLAAFDSTGPFVISIFKIISEDVPYFMKFYLILLFGFSCALSLLTNTGNPDGFYSIKHLVLAIWSLIQTTVETDPTYGAVDITGLNPDLFWLADILLTAFNFCIVIMMLNLLIAMMSSTYEKYNSYNDSLLLMEKYNIMSCMERSMMEEERQKMRIKYCSVRDVSTDVHVKKGEEDGKPPHLIKDKIPHGRQSSNISDDDGSVAKSNRNLIAKNVKQPSMKTIADQQRNESVKQLRKKAKSYSYEYQEVMENWWSAEALNQDVNDDIRETALFIIDPQNDFHAEGGKLNAHNPMDAHHGQGSLAVNGANEDSRRIAEMIIKNIEHIHEIFVSMDSHYPNHIAHAMSWVGKDGKPPSEFEVITLADVKTGVWSPTDNSSKNQKWVEYYIGELEKRGRMQLTIWPEHCIIGTPGHCVVPVINHALQEWAEFHHKPVTYVLKGQNIRVEMYSAFAAEVEDPLDGSTALNMDLLSMLRVSDRVSHDLLNNYIRFFLLSFIFTVISVWSSTFTLREVYFAGHNRSLARSHV